MALFYSLTLPDDSVSIKTSTRFLQRGRRVELHWATKSAVFSQCLSPSSVLQQRNLLILYHLKHLPSSASLHLAVLLPALSMASFLEHHLSCPTCRRIYQDPQLLSCGHSFCLRCLDQLFTANFVRICPECHEVSPRKPVANLVLKKTCETYLSERERERQSDGEARCSQHGEKISLFCETDEMVICSECRRCAHSSHSVKDLAQAVRQRKRQVRAALYPAEKALESSRHGTTRHSKMMVKIQGQAQRTERLIRKDFKKLRQFLKEQEESRVAALMDEAQRKTELLEEREEQLLSLWDGVRGVEGELENDDAAFLQNYGSVLLRAQNTVPDPEVDSGAQINMGKHLGNLRYSVWEKMKDLCPHYSIFLDPNTTPAGFSISEDLTELRNAQDPGPVPHPRNRIVLGSEGYTNGFHCWDVDVGDSRQWTIGVCRRSAVREPVPNLTPAGGFWGLRREGDTCDVLGSTSTWPWLTSKPRTVRVKLGRHFFWRTVSFYNASSWNMIGSSEVPTNEELTPFLIPGERSSVMRIPPDPVTLTVRKKLGFIRWFIDVDERMMPLCIHVLFYVGYFVVLFFVAVLLLVMKAVLCALIQ